MKSILLLFLFLLLTNTSFAQKDELAIIKSIDDIESFNNYVEVSEEALPGDHYSELIKNIKNFKFSILKENFVRDLFNVLEKNPKSRMKSPGGKCSQRRAFIQNYLKRMDIVSGKLLVSCPAKNGKLRLKDQVTRRYYTYSNFHDVNIVAVNTNSGKSFRVLDIQFKDSPVSLHDYLSEIEASQKIRPAKRKEERKKSTCYWRISSPYHSY